MTYNIALSAAAGQPATMSSREIAQLTGKEHKNVTRDIEKMLAELEEDALKFEHIYFDSMNRSQTEYLLDRELTETLLTGYSAVLRRKVIARWRELESTTKVLQLPDFTNPAESARAWAREFEAKEKAQKELALAAPKVLHYDKVVERSTLVTTTQVGQKVGMSAVALNKVLEELKVYSKGVKRARVFQQWFIDKGYGELKQTELGYTQALFTMAGEAWVIEKLTTEGVI